MITQYMGMPMRARPCIRSFRLKPGDRLLLCTDGLTDMLDPGHIREILMRHAAPGQAADDLVRQANAAGGIDNITTLLIDWR